MLDTTAGVGQFAASMFASDEDNGYSPQYDNLDLAKTSLRVYSENEIGVLQNLGKSKYGDTLLCHIIEPRNGKNRLAIVRTVNDRSLKREFIGNTKLSHQLSSGNCDKFAKLLGIIETPLYFASITEHAECDLNYFLRKSSKTLLRYAYANSNLLCIAEFNLKCIFLQSPVECRMYYGK